MLFAVAVEKRIDFVREKGRARDVQSRWREKNNFVFERFVLAEGRAGFVLCSEDWSCRSRVNLPHACTVGCAKDV